MSTKASQITGVSISMEINQVNWVINTYHFVS